MTVDPKALTAGTIVRHRSGHYFALDHRSGDGAAWVCEDGSSIADDFWSVGTWTVTGTPEDALTVVLNRIEFRLGRLEEAAATNTERLEHIMINQAGLDADLQALGSAVGQLVTAYESASAKATAAGVDLSVEDAQVKQLEGRITSALAAAPPASTSAALTDPVASTSSSNPGPAAAAPETAANATTASTAPETAPAAESAPTGAVTPTRAPDAGQVPAAAADTASTPADTWSAPTDTTAASLPAGSVPGATAQGA